MADDAQGIASAEGGSTTNNSKRSRQGCWPIWSKVYTFSKFNRNRSFRHGIHADHRMIERNSQPIRTANQLKRIDRALVERAAFCWKELVEGAPR